jgi:maltose alpha-D-glucosyltransferase / alpha-amylase
MTEAPAQPWYKDAIIYELHVRSFFDANGDGSGDFQGLMAKLDYLLDLGVTCLWLLPFYPSPMVDDGYDIADYTDVNPDYGTLRDVRAFIREAHGRGLRVITELVCNHTSDQHPWFQRARRAPRGSPERDFYVWSDSTDRYADARVIFRDVEPSNWTWDEVAGQFYWHRFYAQQPDLNFDSPHVRREILRAMDFWFAAGVDGLRLDAVPYLYEREGTNCENLPETHTFLRNLRARIDSRYDDRLLLAEANQWPEDAVAYFGNGDECHMCFHFPLMPRLYMALRTEDRFPVVDIMAQTPALPDSAQWALFLRNHDELTLEMVTDEERDYMWRVYAADPLTRLNLGIRRRLAPLLGNDRRRMELMYGLLLSLPGTPVLYYGDEIGMGDNVALGDRNGVRTPMQWDASPNAGFSTADPSRLKLPVITEHPYHYQAVNVEAQQADSHSTLWFQKRLIALRKQSQVFGRGSIEFLHPENRHVLAYLRTHGSERVLVVANLSRFVQHAELDLGAFGGQVPVEMFSRNEFPSISANGTYPLTLGPHDFYWLQLTSTTAGTAGGSQDLPELPAVRTIDGLFRGAALAGLTAVLPAWLRGRRWYGSKARRQRQITLRDVVPLPQVGDLDARVGIFQIDYVEGEADLYVLPLALADVAQAQRLVEESPGALIAQLPDGRLVFDAFMDPRAAVAVLGLLDRQRKATGRSGTLHGVRTAAFRRLRGPTRASLSVAPIRAEQSNTSVVFDDRLILKLYRRVEPGINPDFEIGRLLTEHDFASSPPMAGAVEYHAANGESITLGILQAYVPNESDAWAYSLDSVDQAYDRALEAADISLPASPSVARLVEVARTGASAHATAWVGPFLESVRLLGVRTAELHRVLATASSDPAFAAEPISSFYQRSIYQGARAQVSETFSLLSRRRDLVPADDQGLVDAVLKLQPDLVERMRAILSGSIDARRTRIHGDYHAGQVLWTGSDFMIIDFEGEPGRPMSERRLKRSPLRDVAGMLRSFHYAAYGTLKTDGLASATRPEDVPRLRPWARLWYEAVAGTFLGAYLSEAAGTGLYPRDDHQLITLLDVLLLQKALYEVVYELNNRPAWTNIPLQGILEICGVEEDLPARE